MEFEYQEIEAADHPKEKKVATCKHCGLPCLESQVSKNGHRFCCQGCAMIFTLLERQKSGKQGDIDIPRLEKWAFLDAPKIQDLLLKFKEDDFHRVHLDLPQVHCSSCIQILEKLPQLHGGILSARLNFPKKQLTLSFDPNKISLRQVAELLEFVGYPPSVQLSSDGALGSTSANKRLLLQMGVAGFVFGNVMLMSFPVYFRLDDLLFERLFGYLSLALCIPLLTYSASDYLRSAYAGILHKNLNIDVPISIGALTLFLRSAYEVLSHTGTGYFDSLSGFIFFLLVGKWIQQRTYSNISFDRAYQHYFPLHATLKKKKKTLFKPLNEVVAGDILFVRNGELIPTDGILLAERTSIDYSFVTGEERPVSSTEGDKVFAGGKNVGAPIEVMVSKRVDQSYLTSLWEEEPFQKAKKVDTNSFIDRVGKHFTLTILIIALLTLAYWLYRDPSMAIHAFTSVLIIACPCVLALSTPFTYGTMRSLLSRIGIFFRNTQALESLYKTTDIIFDKTGTLTSSQEAEVVFEGGPLTDIEKAMIYSLATSSTHPLSRAIAGYWKMDQEFELKKLKEVAGAGIIGSINGHWIKLGSSSFVNVSPQGKQDASIVHLKIDTNYCGYFVIRVPLRKGIRGTIDQLKLTYPVFLLSGDRRPARQKMQELLGLQDDKMYFEQSPFDKLNFIRSIQESGHTTLMIGDGLNDAGAFKQSDLSIVVTEDLNNFTPASDVILRADQLTSLPGLFSVSRQMLSVLYIMYGFSFLYNGIGLWFAVRGLLSPVVAAILMPISSVSIVVVGTLLSHWIFRKNMGKNHIS